MNNLSILIVDDDLKKISVIIKTIREAHSETLFITQASNVMAAIEELQKKEFHLLISDLLMPLKHDDTPNRQGGESLVRSLYRKKTKVNMPMYIVGLTQFIELQNTFKAVWKVWHFDSSSEEWKINLRDLIHHISLVKSKILINKIETIFVEGPIDKDLIEHTLRIYFPNIKSSIYIDTISYGGGAAWVERQLFIWAKTLTKTQSNNEYLKAVGIFDNDSKGNNSIVNLRKIITPNSAESKTFSIIKNSFKYSQTLKSIKTKGITFQTTIEDLISIECWQYAKQQNWLEQRDPKLYSIDKSKFNNDEFCINLKQLLENDFTDDESLLILYKIKNDYKNKFCQYILKLEHNQKLLALKGISYLLNDSFKKLKLNTEVHKS